MTPDKFCSRKMARNSFLRHLKIHNGELAISKRLKTSFKIKAFDDVNKLQWSNEVIRVLFHQLSAISGFVCLAVELEKSLFWKLMWKLLCTRKIYTDSWGYLNKSIATDAKEDNNIYLPTLNKSCVNLQIIIVFWENKICLISYLLF